MNGSLQAAALGVLVVALASHEPAQAGAADSAVNFRGCSSLESTEVRVDQRVTIRLDMDETLDLMVLAGERSWTVMDANYRSTALDLKAPATYSFTLRELTGRSWDASGRASESKVFQAPGNYALYFADNLETEPDNSLHCLIRLEVTSS